MSVKQALTCSPYCTGCITTAGTVFARIAMGSVCDYFGPRYGERRPLYLQQPPKNNTSGLHCLARRLQRRAHNLCPGWGRLAPGWQDLHSLIVRSAWRSVRVPAVPHRARGGGHGTGDRPHRLHRRAHAHRLGTGCFRHLPVLEQHDVLAQRRGHRQLHRGRLGQRGCAAWPVSLAHRQDGNSDSLLLAPHLCDCVDKCAGTATTRTCIMCTVIGGGGARTGVVGLWALSTLLCS